MRIKIKKVYYCEHCGIHKLTPLVKHEKHCTKNPDRECRLCGRKSSLTPLILNLQYLISHPEKLRTEIKDIVKGCPVCTLTVLRCGEFLPFAGGFDYKEELEIWWEQKRIMEEKANDHYQEP